ncbi:MAG: Glycosyl hydrolase family 92 [Bacteroidetes bacterium ADurb.Bin037]|nr:MAG: Glycosyl hydrolase family 92 [Bacteroidetes bacterium ADurb.Bin037]HPW78282.1 GH92 family glycosyl hydrolase [Bacteroidales bacterium]HQB56115.1 GH92 family glycosyl hydrolase [Bacteroidales bacterium]
MNFSALLRLFALFSLLTGTVSCTTSYTQYVDPLIGSGGHGHVFVGANVPFGLVQTGPVQFNQGWDWCSGYHYSDSTIIGFAQMHLSGTGIGDLGDILLMPFVGNVVTDRKGLCARFSHEREEVRPGYYAVELEGSGIKVCMTATPRVAFHKYTFPENDQPAGVVIDLEHGIGWDSPVEGHLEWDGDKVVNGYRISSGWARNQEIYFTTVFSAPVLKLEMLEGTEPVEGNSLTAKKAYARIWLDISANREIMVKVALSPKSMEKARANLEHELPGWDFKATAAAADKAWNRELSKIDYQIADPAAKEIFYTALYHTMMAPSLFCDHDKAEGFTKYTTFSLWDTYRAAHPLATIIHPEKMEDFYLTMLDIFDTQGKLPVWHLMGNETDCMVGNPGIPVLADMVLKGYGNDPHRAYEAMKRSAMLDERGLKWYKQYGYIPYDKDPAHETVAKTLEYALADWCVAQVAARLGDDEGEKLFTRRSKAYVHLFDPQTGFIRGRSSDGKWREPFSPFRSSHREDDYTEGNAWQYTWLVPHDIAGLIDLFGGREPFLSKLDSLFVAEGDLGEDASPDITGLIGQYAHGNEPSHHIAYMYAYAGQPEKTASRVRQILTTMYRNTPDGLSGNEDVGQMSAWYVLSAMGFYQVEPAGGRYVFGSPLMDKAVIRVGGDRTFTILAHHNSSEKQYIKNIRLNGKPYHKIYIDHDDIMAGGVLEFDMK